MSLVASHPDRLKAWVQDVIKNQDAAREAGLAWFRREHDKVIWSERPKEDRDRDLFCEVLGYFRVALGVEKLSAEALDMIDRYRKLPLQPNSGELATARIRIIREMIQEEYWPKRKRRV